MRRREFMKLLGGAATCPLPAHAQPADNLPIIGLLFADAAVFRPWIDAFVERLRAVGWIEGRNVVLKYRWSTGPERDAEIAAEFVRLKVDVVVTDGPSVPTLKHETATIPIVFALASDPVGG